MGCRAVGVYGDGRQGFWQECGGCPALVGPSACLLCDLPLESCAKCQPGKGGRGVVRPMVPLQTVPPAGTLEAPVLSVVFSK